MPERGGIKRKPRLPDRLLGELARRKEEVGRRRDAGESRKRGETRLTRKEMRSAARVEKKRKRIENAARYRERVKKKKQPSNKQRQHHPAKPTDHTAPTAPPPISTQLRDTRGRVTGRKRRGGGEVATRVSSKDRGLKRAREDEKMSLQPMAQKLGMADQVKDEEDLNLDGLLDGFDDVHVEGIPDEESPSDSDPAQEGVRKNGRSGSEVDKKSESSEDSSGELHRESSAGTSDDGEEAAPTLVCLEESSPAPMTGKYIPPGKRTEVMVSDASIHQKREAIDRRLRGLLNRLSEQNIKGIVQEMVKMYESMGRTLVSSAIAKELIKATAEGPRATDHFVGIAAAAVSAICTLAHSHEISATFLSHSAEQLEQCYQKGDSLGTLNSTSLLCHLYLCGLVTSHLLYGLLHQLASRFEDLDVSMIYRVLEACGLRLRCDDPEEMKRFVMDVHNRAAQKSREGSLSQRAELMLDLVIDVKNNKLSRSGKRESFKNLSPVVGKWLSQIEVSNMALVDLSWEKVISQNKTGPWWLPDSQDAARDPPSKKLLSSLGEDRMGSELLSLAVSQRMNTDVRKAVFCAIMGAQDVLDACEKLLRLPLKGEQDREVMRVLLECCLQEKRWNPFYSAVASRLCLSKKSHSITLKFCLMDKLKTLDELDVRALDHVAKFMAELLHKEALPLGMMKGVDFSLSLSEKALFFWRITFFHLLLAYRSCDSLLEAFSRLAMSESLLAFARKLLIFLKYQFQPWMAKSKPEKTPWVTPEQHKTLLERTRKLQSFMKQLHSA